MAKKHYDFIEAMRLVNAGYKVRNLDWDKWSAFIMRVKPTYRLNLDCNVRNNEFIAMFHKNGSEYFPEPYTPTTLDMIGGSNWVVVELEKKQKKKK